jgi:repressor of nif and glnA expression
MQPEKVTKLVQNNIIVVRDSYTSEVLDILPREVFGDLSIGDTILITVSGDEGPITIGKNIVDKQLIVDHTINKIMFNIYVG